MNIYQSIAAIMAETDAIKKEKRNTQQDFKFRGIDDVYNAIHPLMAKHGVFSVPTVLDVATEERTTKSGTAMVYRILKIQYTFFASDGSFVVAIVIGEANDSGDKACSKAMAIGHKYALLQILSIPTEDMPDPDQTAQPKDDPIVGKKDDSIIGKKADVVDDTELRSRALTLLEKSAMPDDLKARWIAKMPTVTISALDGLFSIFKKEGLTL